MLKNITKCFLCYKIWEDGLWLPIFEATLLHKLRYPLSIEKHWHKLIKQMHVRKCGWSHIRFVFQCNNNERGSNWIMGKKNCEAFIVLLSPNNITQSLDKFFKKRGLLISFRFSLSEHRIDYVNLYKMIIILPIIKFKHLIWSTQASPFCFSYITVSLKS